MTRSQTASGPPPPPTPPAVARSRARKVLSALGSMLVVVVLLGFAMPRLTNADYRQAWDRLLELDAGHLVWLNVASLWNIASYWWMLMLTLPGLTWAQAMVVNNASTAVANTVPGGGALGLGVTWRFLSSWGFGGEAISRHVLVVGLWNNFLKLGLPIVAVGILAFDGEPDANLITAAIAGTVALAVSIGVVVALLSSERAARAIGEFGQRLASSILRLFRRPPVEGWADGASRFRDGTAEMVRHRAAPLSIAGVIDHLALYLVLLLALRYVGVGADQVDWQLALAVFAAVRLASALPITPGGLGVVELGMVDLLSRLGTGGGDAHFASDVLAAVLIYRFVTYVTPIVLGAICALYYLNTDRWRVAPA